MKIYATEYKPLELEALFRELVDTSAPLVSIDADRETLSLFFAHLDGRCDVLRLTAVVDEEEGEPELRVEFIPADDEDKAAKPLAEDAE